MPEYFYTPPENINPRQAVITGDEARHISKVLRHKKGDLITIVDGLGGEYQCSILTATDNSITAAVVNKLRKSREPIARVTLAQAVPKGQRMDFAVEKGTELGLFAIIPMFTHNSAVKDPADKSPVPMPAPEDEGPGHKAARWQRIAVSAMKQSLRSVLPLIHQPEDLKYILSRHQEYDLIIMADETESKHTVRAVFSASEKSCRNVLCLAGPEGGFTGEERELARGKGVHIVSLGPRRLRAETAGITLSTLVLAELGEI